MGLRAMPLRENSEPHEKGGAITAPPFFRCPSNAAG